MKIAIYTAIFGNKDALREPSDISNGENIDFYVITDNNELKSNFYTVLYKPCTYSNVAKNSRLYKILGVKEFESYDYVIWHDANLQIIVDEVPRLVQSLRNNFLATFKHPLRRCFMEESIACIKDKKDNAYIILLQCILNLFRGLSPDSGLYETSILVKRNKNFNKRFFEQWWKEVKFFSRRDQISLPYVKKKMNEKVDVLEGDRINNPYSIFYAHKYDNYISKGKLEKLEVGLLEVWIIKVIERLKMILKKQPFY
ncbi:DUF616 domain-containing protein [Zunongwangia sp. F260]|uniref:DUF616 domain-containing protein n=1 Tax=Autumnicola lenta TaxID=3075593 RepID=A0ABU3CG57_9FLAO|nr:glycosyltransferase domain-containing protein [Zunongwangia sp. F260]MDT0645315.1 DUF616 domain-containing protein [Zunongwangia sp. F260]